MKLTLASTSPRRREVLALLGVPFEIIPPAFQEQVSDQLPIGEEVLQFALGKAQSVARTRPGSIVIGSDTMILFDGRKIGKPADEADAGHILGLLSGKRHTIYTSVAIMDGTGGPGLRTVDTVEVEMRRFTAEEIRDYLAIGESLDKAAAYSIQGKGGKLIESIRGDYLAAVGLPLKPIARYLERRGTTIPCDVDKLYREKRFHNWHRFS
jgi:septum formation protein